MTHLSTGIPAPSSPESHRIVYDAYKINIESINPSKDVSMREVYDLDQTTAQ